MRFRLTARSRSNWEKQWTLISFRSVDTRSMRQKDAAHFISKKEPGSVRSPLAVDRKRMYVREPKELLMHVRWDCQLVCLCRNGKKIIKELPKSAMHFWKD